MPQITLQFIKTYKYTLILFFGKYNSRLVITSYKYKMKEKDNVL